MTSGSIVRLGVDSLRVVPWRGRDNVVLMTPVANRPAPNPVTIGRCLDLLAMGDIELVVTGALARVEQTPFLEAGFTVREELHLLCHTLHPLPDPPAGIRTRRARRRDRTDVLSVDHLAFDDFWRLDAPGLDDAIGATSSARLRVATDPGIVGYAVTGRSGSRGYIQRLAVHPQQRGRGIGAALVIDGLRWLQRHGADSAVVNTQQHNHHALDLYRRLGFQMQSEGLAVLSRRVADRDR